jgi:D-beta-D-heptose 7-phosphate kinase / D-beta-D-heptose 1-phosphate adenosyltransferase
LNELLQRHYDFRPKVAVYGDAMLDEYYEVEADKISPEFPIPVLRSGFSQPHAVALGGAANVCAQFRNFNFDVSLFALTNERLKSLGDGINMDGCIFSKSIPVKKRYYSGEFPLCRIDSETSDYNYEKPYLREMQDKILGKLASSGPYDVVVFSNYEKGMFSGLQDFASVAGDAITIVDPKAGPAERWKGCTIIKPNAKEAKDITGLTDWKDQCSYLMDVTGCQAVVITRGGDDVVGNVQGVWFEYKPPTLVRAKSVVGAGDCFVAFLAMCMCHSIDIRRAVAIAFEACSCYVRESYNNPIYPYQIEPSKFINPMSLANRDFKLAFANGCFDILHPGHVELLKYARTKADGLAVALNTDESVLRQNKSHPPVNNLEFRREMVAALGCVDFVLEFNDDTPYELIKKIKPDVLVKGSDWPDPVGSDLVGEVFSFDLFGGYSTTGIIEKIWSSAPK